MSKIIQLADGLKVEVEFDNNHPQFISTDSTKNITSRMNEIKDMLLGVVEPISDSYNHIASNNNIEEIKVSLGIKVDLEGNFILAKSTVGANIAVELKLGKNHD